MVKAGFKQTEVGVIPADWECHSLSEYIKIIHGFAFQSQFFDSQGSYRLMTPGHFYEEGGFRDIGEKQKYYKGPFPSEYIINDGELIVAMTEQADGLLGSAALVPINDLYLHNQRLGRVKPISQSVNIEYLYFLFNSSGYRIKIRETAAGTKVKHTSPKKLLEIEAPFPPYPEQQAIAAVLSDVDALIAGLDKLIAKKRDIKTGTMQQLLTGEKRLPGFGNDRNGRGYKQTEIGRIPEEWEVIKLGEFTEQVGSGITPTGGSKVYIPSGRPFVRSQNVGWGMLKLDDLVYIDEETHRSFISSEIQRDDVLLNITGASIGRSSMADERIALGNVNQHVCLIRTKQNELDAKFLNLFLLSTDGQKQIDSFQAGGNRQGLNFGQIRSFKLAKPNLIQEQRAITEVISDVELEIAALEARRAKTQAIKQGMMQELLTGRTRLNYD